MIDPRDTIIGNISLEKSRVRLSPHLTFLCGGEVDVTTPNKHSVRNMMMRNRIMFDSEDVKFVLAENYKDWKNGYSSLSDFENDIAFLSSKVVVVPESAGSLAELGLFFGNSNIREKMTVILNTPHHQSDSFIKFGILNPLEHLDEESVLPYEIDYYDVENILDAEVDEALQEVIEQCQKMDSSKAFTRTDRGHELFLLFQIVDLFHAITKKEIKHYLSLLGFELQPSTLKSSLYILEKFELIKSTKRGGLTCFYANPEAEDRVDLKHSNHSVTFDYLARKTEVLGYYKFKSGTDGNYRKRLKIINSIGAHL